MGQSPAHIDFMTEFKKPFYPSRVQWEAVEWQGDKARVVTAVAKEFYAKRLDDAVGAEWSVSYVPWGERLICHLTVLGITRSSTGETEAQAFIGACNMFGLGRYLTQLPVLWVDYSATSGAITERERDRLNGIIQQDYNRSNS